MTTIKDFIYLDTDRLNSLYSQVFAGVVETIVETELNEEENQNSQKGGVRFSGSTIEERVAAASYKTESKQLYDHMYNLLERKLADSITTITTISKEDYHSVTANAFLIKVHGTAELWDFQR